MILVRLTSGKKSGFVCQSGLQVYLAALSTRVVVQESASLRKMLLGSTTRSLLSEEDGSLPAPRTLLTLSQTIFFSPRRFQIVQYLLHMN